MVRRGARSLGQYSLVRRELSLEVVDIAGPSAVRVVGNLAMSGVRQESGESRVFKAWLSPISTACQPIPHYARL